MFVRQRSRRVIGNLHALSLLIACTVLARARLFRSVRIPHPIGGSGQASLMLRRVSASAFLSRLGRRYP